MLGKLFSDLRCYFKARIIIIALMGMCSGIPLPLSLGTLSVLLTEYGVSKTSIGVISMVGIFYSCKFLWAPIVDTKAIPIIPRKQNLRRRRSWIVLCLPMLSIFIYLLSVISPKTDLQSFTLCLLCIILFSTILDISVDAFRIESIDEEEQGLAAAAYTFAYRIGIFFSSAGALMLSSHYSWQLAFGVLSIPLLISMVCVYLYNPPVNEKYKKASKKRLSSGKKNSSGGEEERSRISLDLFVKPVMELAKQKGVILLFIIIVTYKLSDAYIAIMISPFLLELGFTKMDIAIIVKTYCLISTILGGIIGGTYVKNTDINKAMIVGAILQIVTNFGFVLQYYLGVNKPILLMVMSLENFCGGFSTVIFVVFLSRICGLKFVATQYAILTSLSSLGRTMIAGSSGLFVDTFGWVAFFFFSGTLSVPAIICVHILNRRKNETSTIHKSSTMHSSRKV